MSQNLFNSVKSLYKQLNIENLDIHSTQKELESLVELARQNPKLRIIMQLIAVLEALARNFEYDDAQIISKIKTIIKDSLTLIIDMVNGDTLDFFTSLNSCFGKTGQHCDSRPEHNDG